MTLKSIDLFAGIGGIRLGFDRAFGDGIETVFVSEWDLPAQKTYAANFAEPAKIYGDITLPETKEAIPDFDICLAGFPCQAFSMAGKRMGFNDDYKGRCRGTLFFDVAEICEKHKPRVIFCENVKGLTHHDRGRTFKVIRETLEQLGYNVHAKVLNSKDFGVPQNRERIYIVAFRKDLDSSSFAFPEPTDTTKTIADILEGLEAVPKEGRAPERLTAGPEDRLVGCARGIHQLGLPVLLLENRPPVGAALTLLPVGGPEHAFSRELQGEAVGEKLPLGGPGGGRRGPARKRKDAPAAARAPVKRFDGLFHVRRETVRDAGGLRRGIRKERGVGSEQKAREGVVPEGIEFREVGEVPGRLLEAGNVGDRFENEQPGADEPVDVCEARVSAVLTAAVVGTARDPLVVGERHAPERGRAPGVPHDFGRAKGLPEGQIHASFHVHVLAADAEGRGVRVGRVTVVGHLSEGDVRSDHDRKDAGPADVGHGIGKAPGTVGLGRGRPRQGEKGRENRGGLLRGPCEDAPARGSLGKPRHSHGSSPRASA